jgi:hypothetical protein
VDVPPGQTHTVADIKGPGMIRHIWMTWMGRTPERARNAIIRIYWDGQKRPSVEASLGDFFGLAHGRHNQFSSVYMGASAKERALTASSQCRSPNTAASPWRTTRRSP